ncbi:MAG: hypothetical protein KJ952_01055, partial [Candidatus Omnitrophica bacterium]|nr:hypothetical protein [Candidatus Omnitrophota bacterium]
GINNRDECVLLSRRLLDIKRVVDRELIRKRHLKKAIEKAREELAMARSRCEEMIAALPLHITKANLRRERKRIERGFQILELERKLREAENALRRQTVTKDDYGGLLRDEASALASGGERQAVPITPDELRARDVALGDDAEKIKKLLIATLEQLISIKAETLLHNGYLDDALAVYQNALAIVDTIDSLNIFSEDLPADYIQAYFSYRYIIETRIRDIEILQSPTGDLSSAIELAKYRPLEGVRGVVQRNIIGDITNDDVRTVILRSTIKRDSGEDNIIYTVLIFDNPDSDTHHLIGNADITLSEDFKLASHPSTVTFKTKESPRMGAMEKAIIGLIVHGVIQEWHSCVDPSESTQGMYARMKDDRRVQVVEREESQDEAEHPMFIVRESLTAQINAEATVGISRKAQPGRTYTDAQVFIRSATSINSTDDVLAWTETINEGNVAVILAMNMDEYRKIAAMKVEKYVEIRLVVDMEDEEINLAEHLIIRLDGEQIRRLINEVFVFYEDGIDLQTVDDILNEGTRETLRKA